MAETGKQMQLGTGMSSSANPKRTVFVKGAKFLCERGEVPCGSYARVVPRQTSFGDH